MKFESFTKRYSSRRTKRVIARETRIDRDKFLTIYRVFVRYGFVRTLNFTEDTWICFNMRFEQRNVMLIWLKHFGKIGLLFCFSRLMWFWPDKSCYVFGQQLFWLIAKYFTVVHDKMLRSSVIWIWKQA